jgi:3'-phosphoadenosine 5'-phosphosulfate sulfotransferase (PAPS reductase)/FAD synthetase
MEYIASISYGKDSLAMLEVIKQHNMPLDRIVHVEIMATDTIPADLPPMMEFKTKADEIIKARYGIEVEHIHAPKSYEECFYHKRSRGIHKGVILGFPMILGNWCNGRLKVEPMQKTFKDSIQYIGIAADEPNRFNNLTNNKRSPLVEHDVNETQAFEICKSIELLSPTYTQSARGGCWFCHNQSLRQLRLLRIQYPELWALLMKWDKDSPVSFRADGITVHDLDFRFAYESGEEVKENGKTIKQIMVV